MLLAILKGIGIFLLIILCIIIFIFCVVLFFPIHYGFEGSYHEQPDGRIQIRWFPLLLKVQVTMHEGQFEYVVRLFGGVIMTNTGQKLSWIGRKIATFTEEQSESDELTEPKPSSERKPHFSPHGLVQHQSSPPSSLRSLFLHEFEFH